MSRARQLVLLSLAAGALFGLGLVVSGMTRPEKVLGFLDVTGSWDPTLLAVMGGAVSVNFVAHRWARARSPWLGERWFVPAGTPIDARLCIGAAIFGIGWGLGGYCPGPALVSLASGSRQVLIFVAGMLAGMWLVRPLLGAPRAGALAAGATPARAAAEGTPAEGTPAGGS